MSASSTDKPGRPSRWVEILLRSIHLVAMAVVLGGVAFDVAPQRLNGPFLVTASSGLLLMAVMMWSRCLRLARGAGWALFLKLGLLGLGQAIPSLRLELFAAAVLVASVGSHMPSTWRHKTLGGAPLADGE